MNDQSRCVLNKDELELERRLMPYVDMCAALLVEEGKPKSVSRQRSEDAPEDDWLVLTTSMGAGFAVRELGTWAGLSAIQKQINRITVLKAIARASQGCDQQRVSLSEDSFPPNEWVFFRVCLVQGDLWCAMSTTPPAIGGVVERKRGAPFVRVRVLGELSCEGSTGVGCRIELGGMSVAIPDLHAHGRLLFKKERGMAIEIGSIGEGHDRIVPGVRLDLGEIEISLAEVSGLGSGSVICLGPVAPHRCFLRIGSSTIAEGEVSTEGDELRVTITRVV